MPQITVRDVNPHEFIKAYADFLKSQGKMDSPKWIDYVKTGRHKQLSPDNVDWYFVRAASIARKIYLRPGTGVGALRRQYGGNYRRGVLKERFSKSSGGIIRTILQNLERNGVVEMCDEEEMGGRQITESGRGDLDRIAAKIGGKAVGSA